MRRATVCKEKTLTLLREELDCSDTSGSFLAMRNFLLSWGGEFHFDFGDEYLLVVIQLISQFRRLQLLDSQGKESEELTLFNLH